jgi:hypothetical protein
MAVKWQCAGTACNLQLRRVVGGVCGAVRLLLCAVEGVLRFCGEVKQSVSFRPAETGLASLAPYKPTNTPRTGMPSALVHHVKTSFTERIGFLSGFASSLPIPPAHTTRQQQAC